MSTSKGVARDDEFYFQDVVFQAENRLFKVPRHVFLQQSQVFRDMFSLPVPQDTKPEGMNDDSPLILSGVRAIDFSRLLRYLFPVKQISDSFPLKTLDEWTSVFKLAALWEMEDVKANAIEQMTPLLKKLPAKQVKLSLEYAVEKWLVPGLNRLVQREEPLDKNDVEMIGWDYALKIMVLREDCHLSPEWSIERRGEVSMDCSKEIRVRFNIRD
ncbi:hypothetical protein APHAL10511_000657 [Amanita phalloides]|nr:hypothetical protein APHAL10511_000657 [Amanita phalloides]